MANITLGFRLFLLIGLSLALPLLQHNGDADGDSYNEDALQIISFPSQEEEDPDFQKYFKSVSEFVAKAPSEPSEESGQILARWTPESGVNPEEIGGYLEGDIVSPKKSASRTGLVAISSRWPNGIVPYVIDSNFTRYDKSKILDAFSQFQNKTCNKFVPRTNQLDYIKVTNTFTGCWSYVGRVGGMQQVNLQSPGCLYQNGTILHELMHAVGFIHEQGREDRDNYVTIYWENILAGRENNFAKATPNTTTSFGIWYDYGSVMHYATTSFSKNNLPTILPKLPNATIGQRIGFSSGDIFKLRRMYGCG